jgi:hypothetical protein
MSIVYVLLLKYFNGIDSSFHFNLFEEKVKSISNLVIVSLIFEYLMCSFEEIFPLLIHLLIISLYNLSLFTQFFLY